MIMSVPAASWIRISAGGETEHGQPCHLVAYGD
jgi:hypothetical protein